MVESLANGAVLLGGDVQAQDRGRVAGSPSTLRDEFLSKARSEFPYLEEQGFRLARCEDDGKDGRIEFHSADLCLEISFDFRLDYDVSIRPITDPGPWSLSNTFYVILCAIRGENEAREIYKDNRLGAALARHLDHIRACFGPADYPATKTRLEWWAQELQARWLKEGEALAQQHAQDVAIGKRKDRITYVCIWIAFGLAILYELFRACW